MILFAEVTKLLEEGRKILEDKEQAAEVAAEARCLGYDEIFAAARTAALKLFEPLGASIPVQPTTRPAGCNPESERRLEFYVKPFGGDIA